MHQRPPPAPGRPAPDETPSPSRGRSAARPDDGDDDAGGEQPASRSAPPHAAEGSWSDSPPPPESAPSWASPLDRARATAGEQPEQSGEPVGSAGPRVVDDGAISDDDESIDDLTDVGVPVVERILGGTVIAEEPR